MVHDVAVVGGGPAGACAAFALAEAGARVVLLEKADLPRYKTCGGGVVGRALRALPASLRAAVDASVVERPCHAAALHFGAEGLRFETRRPRPVIAMVMRERFDAALVAAAQAAGAEIRPRCAVRDVVLRADRCELDTVDGPVVARFVIAADGVTGVTARRAGWPPPRGCAPCVEAEVSVGDGDFARLAEVARFDFGVVPVGYGWVFPKRAHLSIGLATTRGGANLHVALARYLEALGLGRPERIDQHGFLIPLAPRAGGVVRGRVLLTGDAAGLADPVTGEGISAAIESGTKAARAILEDAGEPTRVAERYERALGALRRELGLGRGLAHLTYHRPRLRRWIFERCGQTLSDAVTDVMLGDTTYARIVGRARTWPFRRAWRGVFSMLSA
jgi:geranylgeranyl reductase family protein